MLLCGRQGVPQQGGIHGSRSSPMQSGSPPSSPLAAPMAYPHPCDKLDIMQQKILANINFRIDLF